MYKGFIKGSRTLDTQALKAMVGAMLVSMPEARAFLGDYYGVLFIVFSVWEAYLRFDTTGPVDQK